jgi:hypothetical protein
MRIMPGITAERPMLPRGRRITLITPSGGVAIGVSQMRSKESSDEREAYSSGTHVSSEFTLAYLCFATFTRLTPSKPS